MHLNTTKGLSQIYDTHYDTRNIFVPLSTKFVIRNYTNKSGESQIYLHVHSSGKRKRIPLDLYIKPNLWNAKKERGARYCSDLNLILDTIHSSITEIKIQYRLAQRVMTIDKFVEEFTSNFSRFDFIAFFDATSLREKELLGDGTYRRTRSILNKLKRFKKQILFSDIDYSFLNKLRVYLKELGNSDTTIESNMSVIRKYLKEAERMGIRFPLDTGDIKIKGYKSARVSLSQKDIKRLYNHFNSPDITEQHKLILGYFLFSCFTGLRLQDVLNLKREKISDRFKIKMSKSKKHITINLTKTAMAIIQEEPRLFVNFISAAHINRELKYIAKDAKLETEEKVTFHVARHSFATNYLRMGGQLVYLMKLLGHQNIKTTMIYVDIKEEEMNKDIHLLDNLLN